MKTYYDRRAPEYVYERYFTASQLADKLGGEVVHESRWFVVVRS